MILFRSAQLDDLSAIHHLSGHSDIGITTLPKNKKLLKQRLELAEESFHKTIDRPEHEYYLFVLEDTIENKIIGVSAIESATGFDTPFYSYKLSRRTRICSSLAIRSEYQILNLVNDNEGKSELCTLFLLPSRRHNGNGLLLSRARFLFMAQFPERFTKTVIAEMRGVSDSQGMSPFWEHIGRHFFHMSFGQADRLTLATNKQFIVDLMPEIPLLVELLSPEARAVIGKPHESTIPAMNILLQERFQYNGYLDIFDGGPTIEACLSQIRTLTASRLLTVSGLSDQVSSNSYLLAKPCLDFRATVSQAMLNSTSEHCVISKETAALLKIEKGDLIRLSPLYYKEENA